jgi:hypothetical protein
MEQEAPTPKPSGKGPMIILVVVILIAIALLMLNKKPKVTVEPIASDGITQEELDNLENTNSQSELSADNDTETIESELDATSFSEFEADLESFDF